MNERRRAATHVIVDDVTVPMLADDDQHHLDRLLELLPDVPAGKLAIAELVVASRADIDELEQAVTRLREVEHINDFVDGQFEFQDRKSVV